MDSTENTQASTGPRHCKRRALWPLLAIPLAAAAGFGAFKASALAGGFGFGPSFGPGAGPEQHKAFMERRIDRALTVVKASDAQRTAIKAIFERAFAEMRPIHQEHQRLHEDMAAAFAAPTVDRAAVEKLRVQVAALAERGSQVLSRALLDAADVLSAEQRQTLIEHLREMHGRHHRGQG